MSFVQDHAPWPEEMTADDKAEQFTIRQLQEKARKTAAMKEPPITEAVFRQLVENQEENAKRRRAARRKYNLPYPAETDPAVNREMILSYLAEFVSKLPSAEDTEYWKMAHVGTVLVDLSRRYRRHIDQILTDA